MPDSIYQRQQHRFASLDEVNRHLELLLSNGYVSLGKWNLAQVCEHLRDWLLYPLDGYPKSPFPISSILWCIKVTAGKSMLRKLIASGKMSDGSPTAPQSVHDAIGLDDKSSTLRLKDAIKRFEQYSGELRPSPVFGTLSKEVGLQLQLVHCAHHLSFLVLRD
ncbi:MAG: DUF1569 domain-containing protein [Aureliella sp.]